MVENMIHTPKHLSMEETTRQISDELFRFDDHELFEEMVNHNLEVESSSNHCHEEQSTYLMQPYSSNTLDDHENQSNSKTDRPPDQIFDEMGPTDQIHRDISASIDFVTSSAFSTSENHSNQELYNMASLNNHNHFSLGDQIISTGDNTYNHEQWTAVAAPPPQPVVPIQMGPGIQTGFDEVSCPLNSITPPVPPPPSYISLSNSTLVNPMIARCMPMTTQYSAENSGIFTGSGLMFRNDIISQQDLDFQGDRGVPFLPHDTMQRYLNCTSELQALSSEGQHLVLGGASSTTPLSSEITSLDDPSFKAGKLSVEERRRKVDRYREKRNERNFSKKIKYACRKTLADSRPRVRGRFAKNDELGELTRINQDDEIDEDVRIFSNSIRNRHCGKVAVKEEDDATYGSDLFSHLSDVNSLKCNYPINLGFELN